MLIFLDSATGEGEIFLGFGLPYSGREKDNASKPLCLRLESEPWREGDTLKEPIVSCRAKKKTRRTTYLRNFLGAILECSASLSLSDSHARSAR